MIVLISCSALLLCREGLPRVAYLLAEVSADYGYLDLAIQFGQPPRVPRDMLPHDLSVSSLRANKGGKAANAPLSGGRMSTFQEGRSDLS